MKLVHCIQTTFTARNLNKERKSRSSGSTCKRNSKKETSIKKRLNPVPGLRSLRTESLYFLEEGKCSQSLTDLQNCLLFTCCHTQADATRVTVERNGPAADASINSEETVLCTLDPEQVAARRTDRYDHPAGERVLNKTCTVPTNVQSGAALIVTAQIWQHSAPLSNWGSCEAHLPHLILS